MNMYTVVYVVVDDEKLFYYNEMMKSLTSLRMHNPVLKVCVLTDDRTYEILKSADAEVFSLAEVIGVTIGDGYNQTEKSRLLKLTVRQRLQGDLLYIDTDTVICDTLSPIESDKSMGMVLEFHTHRTDVNSYLTDLYDRQCGLDLNYYDLFYNGGVVWSKDDEHAHRIYEKWHSLWEETRMRGVPRDQPSLNYIIQQEIDHIETLDGIWNCQMAREFSMGLNYLADAHIIHYFNIKSNASAYRLGQLEFRHLPYNDEQVVEMLRHPKSQFSKCRLVKLDNDNQLEDCRLFEIWAPAGTEQYKLMLWTLKHRRLAAISEWRAGMILKVIAKIAGIKGRIYQLRQKFINHGKRTD